MLPSSLLKLSSPEPDGKERERMKTALNRLYLMPSVQEWAAQEVEDRERGRLMALERPVFRTSSLDVEGGVVPHSLIQYWADLEAEAKHQGQEALSQMAMILRDALRYQPPTTAQQWGGFLRAAGVALGGEPDVTAGLKALWSVGLDWLPVPPEGLVAPTEREGNWQGYDDGDEEGPFVEGKGGGLEMI